MQHVLHQQHCMPWAEGGQDQDSTRMQVGNHIFLHTENGSKCLAKSFIFYVDSFFKQGYIKTHSSPIIQLYSTILTLI